MGLYTFFTLPAPVVLWPFGPGLVATVGLWRICRGCMMFYTWFTAVHTRFQEGLQMVMVSL